MENNQKMGLSRVIDDMQGKISKLFALDNETWNHTMALEELYRNTDKRLKALEACTQKRRGRRLVGTLALVGIGAIALNALDEHRKEKKAREEKAAEEKFEMEAEIRRLKELVGKLSDEMKETNNETAG